ncbi:MULTISPECIES: ABC transporter permease [Asaia]|uniref:ABC transporter permease n=1 Tax=Asaia TaxID=91914 RepID=UPI001F03F137|nr:MULTISPECIES: ABC transporter permease [Asaia]
MARLKNLFGLFRLQARVIYALLMRELHTRFGRENIGFLWMIGEPALFCGGVTAMWTLVRPSHEHGLPVTAFVVTGYVPLTMWRHAMFRAVKAFEANGSLLFHRQVTPLDIILARVILEVVGTLMAAILVAVSAIVLGLMQPPRDLGILYLGIGMQIGFCLASALIVAALSELSDLVEKSIQVIAYLAIPFSGAFTMVDWLPPKFRGWLLWSPSVQNIEMIRHGQFGSSARAHYNIGYDAFITLAMILVGIVLVLNIRKHIEVQ